MITHYITLDNKIYGFDDTQTDLIPKDAIKIADSFSMAQIPYITLVKGVPTFNQEKYDADILAQKEAEQIIKNAKDSALAKLTSLGLTENEIKALLG